MSRGWNYVPGAWNFICDVCGQKHKSTVGRERWDGLQVCPLCFELRHPQDFVRTKQDKITVPWTRPRSDDVFIYPNYAGNAVAGQAIAGIAITGNTLGVF